jgi:hypothetical protein|tara:strand:- start:576 stop:1598 length:1023 start_codon:yes stop_codon:yes gene_type:complete
MSPKALQAKVKHHHVWADFLRRWSLDGINIHYTTSKGNIVCESVKGVAMEKNFYYTTTLTNEHAWVIRQFISVADEFSQEIHTKYLDGFLEIQAMEEEYKQLEIQVKTVEQYFHATRCNNLENMHSQHEREVSQILEALANENLSILDNENNMMYFMLYLGHQMARTKTFKVTSLLAMKRAGEPPEPYPKNYFQLIDECWWFLSYVLGTNMGASFHQERNDYLHCILINDTNTPFITSDMPLINVHASLKSDAVTPPKHEECDMYYPISPRIAYMLNKTNRFNAGRVEVSAEIVNELNEKMARKANVHLFSKNKETIASLKQHIGANLNRVQSSLLDNRN